MKKVTTEKFIIKSKNIHGEKYDYRKVNYINAKSKVDIICSIHGFFMQTPNGHLSGFGCPKCGIEKSSANKRVGIIGFIERCNHIHNGKYKYFITKYKSLQDIISIECPQHGMFNQYAKHHIKGSGCPKCGFNITGDFNRSSLDKFINKANIIHHDKYDYSSSVYETNFRKTIIKCKDHGFFSQSPATHIKGVGCPLCSESKGERVVRDYLDKNKIKYIRECKIPRLNLTNLRMDFYIPVLDLYIEYQGIQHYEPVKAFGGLKAFKEGQERDNYKRSWCKKNNHNLLEIKYTDYENIDKILNKHILANITSLLT